ncbi:hypothetical protein MPH_00776 [Macrophomina phaseolina MS6]|uniref:Uncharacterized protein n=1 Tax=Macrophomina phaseolina (strain MS6) TaxID=1126212 RepID=K2RH30_MACPH|nr:hypothetical protein MPH_00776 [Macrophomina phaseolina MS6]
MPETVAAAGQPRDKPHRTTHQQTPTRINQQHQPHATTSDSLQCLLHSCHPYRSIKWHDAVQSTTPKVIFHVLATNTKETRTKRYHRRHPRACSCSASKGATRSGTPRPLSQKKKKKETAELTCSASSYPPSHHLCSCESALTTRVQGCEDKRKEEEPAINRAEPIRHTARERRWAQHIKRLVSFRLHMSP